jgi:hypothetical protein
VQWWGSALAETRVVFAVWDLLSSGLPVRFNQDMLLFRDVSRVLERACVPSAVAALVLLALISFMATPARADDSDMWCGAAWACENAVPQAAPARPYVPQIWTAIAISKSTLGNSTAWRAPSQSVAEKLAIDGCNNKVHKNDCSIAISRPNMCIALAVSQNWAWATGQADNYIGADHVAFANCTANGGTNCIITADPCYNDGPVETPPAPAPVAGQPAGAQSVDKQLVGVWEAAVPTAQGTTFDMRSQINANGTFQTTFPGTPTSPVFGSFTASNGVWAWATTTASDRGSYTFINSNQVTMAGKAGVPVTWHRASN